MNQTKKCYKCRKNKNITNFCKNKQKPNNLNLQCKTCARKYYQINKDRICKNQRKKYQENKEEKQKNQKIYQKSIKKNAENKSKKVSCKCGCNETIFSLNTRGKKKNYISGHSSRRINFICKIKKCDKKHFGKGYCQKHYNKEYPEITLKSYIKHLEKISKSFNMNSIKFKYALMSWSSSIKKLDNNICKNCSSKNNLHAHHIQPKSLFPKLALELDNGITLCKNCHSEIHDFKIY